MEIVNIFYKFCAIYSLVTIYDVFYQNKERRGNQVNIAKIDKKQNIQYF